MNYYLVLGIDESADSDEVRRAFRGLVRQYHPDAGPGSSSDAFRQVVEAYETLNDPARRRVYDRALQRARVHTAANSVVPNRRALEQSAHAAGADGIYWFHAGSSSASRGFRALAA